MKYLEQYLRVKRWHERFMTSSKNKVHNMSTDNYQDDLYAFFINCYHLKDWIKNDSSLTQQIRNKVEKFVSESEELNICGDICNGSKHLVLDRPKKSADTKIGSRHFSLVLGHGPIIHIEYIIESNGKKYDTHSLATKCIDTWNHFFKKHHLKFK